MATPTPPAKQPSVVTMEQLTKDVPDSIHPLMEYLLKNLKTVLIAAGVLVGLAAAYAAGQAWQASQQKAANERLGAILAQPDDAAKIKNLQDFVASGPSQLRAGALLALAQTATKSGDHTAAAAAYEQLAKDGDKSGANLARMGQANALLAKGEAAKAYEILAGLKSQVSEGYLSVLLPLTAAAAEAAGNLPAALAAYEDIRARNASLGTAGASAASNAADAYIAQRIAALKAKTGTSAAPAAAPATPTSPAPAADKQ